MDTFPFIIFYSLISFSVLEFSTAANTLTPYQSITNGESLVSSGQSFELGFFSPSGSKNLYLGIWYYKISPETVVWVANRETPIADSYANLTINSDGNLVLFNATKGVIWSSNSSTVQNSSVAQLLNSGNLVLKKNTDADTESSYIWQSFDFPPDTLLPSMKLGWNLKTGLNRYLTSWRDATDPSPGDFTYGVDITGLPQPVLKKGSSEKIYRTGPWNGVRFSGVGVRLNPVSKPSFIASEDELYYMYEATNNLYITRLMLNQLGLLQRFILNEGSSEWAVINAVPNDTCDDYGQCGANGICRINNRPVCECLDGFIPNSQEEWDLLNWSSGCVRRTSLDCESGEGFVKLKNVKWPDLLDFWLKESLNLEECEAECLKNCSCIAYANSDIRGGGSGCLIWFGDLVDIREFNNKDGEQDIYIRMPASELSRHTGVILFYDIHILLLLSYMSAA
ncbi:G-type lectin S-receptor-like serine/threonine-protein kinase At4g27290 [Cornus florida]|uniref:G-type lectin S-receptor-like serine/threonine-protein kinase At4g27290 n=1 Tax=Cornus florida TaxID=4283 RepID=UPI00289CD6FD|nr:G-type lectin S-receptor-like serine/threonine-protein kinase At4g27290 [Cornus florida]